MKTTLGSSPRRQSSMGPRAQANPSSSPSGAASLPAVGRRLDFEQEDSSLQETPALSGSGQRRGQRRSIYSIEPSPSRITNSAMTEETIQEEIISAEDSDMFNGIGEESGLQDIGNDMVLDVEAQEATQVDGDDDVDATADAVVEIPEDVEESEVAPEPVKKPAKRGRKRKSDALEPVQAEEEAPAPAPEPRKRGRKPLEKKDKNAATVPAVPSRRSKRVSDITDQEPSALQDASAGAVEAVETPPVPARPRGRPPKTAAQPEMPPPAKKQNRQGKVAEKENVQPVSKKPKAAPKSKKKTGSKSDEAQSAQELVESGKFVDVYGNPISRADLDQMSTTTTGTRFGRGRHLSVFRELEPDSAATVGRTGRHRVKPINFWANEVVSYDPTGNMQAVVNRVFQEPPKRQRKSVRSKGQKKSLSAIEEEEDDEVEEQPWEEEEDGFVGPYRGYDAANKISTDRLINTSKLYSDSIYGESLLMIVAIAWSDKGIKPKEIADGSFKFTKLASGHVNDDDKGKTFLSWGFLELDENQMKRAKNSSSMHMVFHVQSGAVEIRVHENILIVRQGGVFQVPRGKYLPFSSLSDFVTHIAFYPSITLLHVRQ